MPLPYKLEFFEDDDGSKPVLRWIKHDLSPTKRVALGGAMREILEAQGVGVCKTEWGTQLGGGVFEFRLRTTGSQVIGKGWASSDKADASEQILLRVMCHAHGQAIILLLAGYDKGKEPSARRQNQEIALARQRLAKHRQRRRALRKR